MATWSTVAPSGVTFGAEQSSEYTAVYLKTTMYCAAGRKGDKGYVRARIVFRDGSSGYYYPPPSLQLRPPTSGYAYSPPSVNGKVTLYYTFDAPAGSSIITITNIAFSSQYNTVTVTVPAGSWTISYRGNGSTSGSTANQTKNYGSALTLRQNGYVREGYAFTGWNTAADGSGTDYAAGASYTANKAATLYAQWERSVPRVLVKTADGWQSADAISVKTAEGWQPVRSMSVKTSSGWDEA